MSARTSLPALSLLSYRVNVLLALLFSFLVLGATRADAQGPGNRAGAFLYTGNTPYGAPSNALVNGYAINTTTGTLTTVAGSPFATGGQVLAIAAHPSGRFAYVASGNGTVAAFTVDSLDGSLTPVPGGSYTVGTSGSGTVLAIDPAGKFLYVAGGSSLYAFAIDSTAGGLSVAAGSPYSFIAYSVTVDPSGKYLVAFGGSGSSSYSINGTTGALTAAGSAVTGCGGSFMTFEPSGHFLYGTGNGISACSFDSGSGALALVAGSPLVSPAAGGFSGVAVHPSGAFLYASDLNCNDSGPSNWLYGYLIDPATGGLTAIDGSPFALPGGSGCYYDEAVATEASGNFVYTVDANYGTAAYTVNQTTGALTLASSSFSGPGAFTVTTVPNATSSAATVTGLQIAPSSAQIHTSTLGKQSQFTLAATFSDGSTGFLTSSATWTSSNQSVATVASGLATSTGYGTTTITATVGGQSATASLTVAEPPLSSITVAPSTVTVYQGTAIQLTATGEYADGSSVDVTSTVTWTSSNTSAATVSAGGLVQSVGLGIDTISATLQNVTGTASVTVVPPFVWQTPAPITYGTLLGSAQLDATSGVSGTFTYSPPAGTLLPAGSQSLNVAFTPDSSASASIHGPIASSKGSGPRTAATVTASDSGNPLAAAATVTLVVNQAALSVTANNQSMSYGSAVPALTGTLSGTITGDGITASYSTTATSTSAPGAYPIAAKLNDPNSKLSNYAVSNAPGTLTISKAIATVMLSNLSITYTGSALGATATTTPANLNVTLSYTQNGKSTTSPITVGSYGVVATINDPNYSGSATGTLIIHQAAPTISWTTPATIAYGTALSPAQLNANSTVAGTFSYSPGSGIVLSAGPQTLTATFTPTDTTDYSTATATATLTVTKATPTITWTAPTAITYGTALSPAQLNANSTVAGTFSYSPGSGIVLSAGPQTLTATFTPTDTTDYSTATATATLTVNKATPTITWTAPTAITYGAALSPAQLNASSTVAGTFSYSPASGIVLSAGPQTLTVTFTPTDTTDYSTATATATLIVKKATPTISWTSPTAITYGSSLSGAQLNASSTIAGTFSYSPAAGAVLGAGQQTLSVTFTPTDSTDYSQATSTVSLTVNKATSTITWATPSAIAFGTPLGTAQLNATASVPGTFAYNPAAGIIPPIGNNTLSVTFTPTDSTDYSTATATVTIVVDQPAPAIGSLSPPVASAGGASFTLSVNGTGFTAASTVYWGTTALSTQYVNGTQLTAQVPASAIANTGTGAVTVQNPVPGGGTSNALQFEVASAGSSTPPSFTTVTATVTPGSTASYSVTLSSTASDVSVSCLNLPGGAACSYSATTNAVTITTSSTTPAGTYQITVVFTETLPGAASAFVLLPILLLPLMFVRRRWQAKQLWLLICFGVLATGAALTVGCGGSSNTGPTQSTHQVTTAGAVTLTVQ